MGPLRCAGASNEGLRLEVEDLSCEESERSLETMALEASFSSSHAPSGMKVNADLVAKSARPKQVLTSIHIIHSSSVFSSCEFQGASR
jgi:hypothetical protein